MSTSNIKKLIRIHEVSQLVSLGKSTIRLWVALGKFPPPIPLSPTIKVWKAQDIDNWIESQSVKEAAK